MKEITDRLVTPPSFVDVALPVHVNQTFTYLLPDSMQGVAQPGARVVVPVGRKLTTGYIVGLKDKLGPESDLKAAELKEFVNSLMPFQSSPPRSCKSLVG